MNFVKIPGTSFEMMTTPVTWGQWKEVMGDYNIPMKGKFTRSDNHPVEGLTAKESEEFCNKLSIRKDGYKYRLPTRWEWIHACKGGGKVSYGEPTDIGWFDENSNNRTHPVGMKLPNGYGIYDMLGNVGEWTSTIFERERTVCGLSWQMSIWRIDSLPIGFISGTKRSNTVGFRVIREVWEGGA